MKGRDLILYILENHLEDEPIFKDGKFIGFMSVEDAAIDMDLGTESIRTLIRLGRLPSINVRNGIFIPEKNVKSVKHHIESRI